MFLVLSPFIVLAVGALLLMLAEAFTGSERSLSVVGSIVLFATSACGLAVWLLGTDNVDLSVLAPWIILDRFSLFFNALLPFGAALVCLLSGGYLEEHRLQRGEFYQLIFFTTLGTMFLSAAGDGLTLLLGLETMSIGAYALTAFRRTSTRSVEGGLKYFLLGSFSAALLLFGLALLYGVTGHTDLAGLRDGLAHGGALSDPRVIFALLLVLSGLAFKVSAFPFHMWAPDAYEGAPTPATSLMASTVKAGGFAMAIRVLVTAFGDPASTSWASGWPPVVAWLAVLTITIGNLIAGRQDSVKRMLAYSSVVHAGYMLVGLAAFGAAKSAAIASILFYLVTYTVSTIGALGVLILAGSHGKEAVSYEDLAGIGKRHPALGLAFSFFLLSLAGIPPTAGFFGKWYLVKAILEGGMPLLGVITVLNSVLSAYYYLRVLVFMYMKEPAPGAPKAVPMRSGEVNAALVIAAVCVALLGLRPGATIDASEEAAKTLVQ